MSVSTEAIFLGTLARKFNVRFSLTPSDVSVAGRQVTVGFDLYLVGTHVNPMPVGAGACKQCQQALMALLELADCAVPTVTLGNRHQLTARLVGTAPQVDVALLQADVVKDDVPLVMRDSQQEALRSGGDIVVAVNGEPFTATSEIAKTALRARPGQQLRLRVYQQGQVIEVLVPLLKMQMRFRVSGLQRSLSRDSQACLRAAHISDRAKS